MPCVNLPDTGRIDELAVSLNRMRCKTSDGETWTTVRVREMRERLGLPEYNPANTDRAR